MAPEVPFSPPGDSGWSWYAAGASLDDEPVLLHGPTMRVLRDLEGHEAPAFSFTSSSTPGVDGVEFGDDVTATRPRIALPVLLYARSPAELYTVKSDLIGQLRPRSGTGRLVHTVRATGDADQSPPRSRFVWARYRDGLTGSGSSAGPNWWRFTLVFEASDPWWHSLEPLRATWRGLKRSKPFFPFTFPFTLSESGVAADEPLEVSGDADTWPTYEMRGPFSRVRVTPVGGSTFWEVRRQTGPSELLRLATKPGEESLRLFTTTDGVTWMDAGNAWAVLHPESWFTPLQFMDQVSVAADGTTRDTVITLTADESWNTA